MRIMRWQPRGEILSGVPAMSYVLEADLTNYLDASSHYTSGCFEGIEEVGSDRRYLYSNAF